MLNKIMLMGRLTADPILRQTQSNISVARFTLAVNRRFDKEKADFVDIVCWRNTAEFVSKYFTKGMQVVVCGSLQTRTWQDKDGNNRKTVEVIADEVYFAEGKRDGAAPTVGNDNTDEFLEFSGQDDLIF